jgi:outer membrane protein OmpA-like peptidoglycan-associated protein
MRLGNSVIAAALLAMAPAIAAADSKVYVDIAGGANFLQDADISGTGLSTEADFDPGFAVKAAVGNAMDTGFRFEAEVAYRGNDADGVGASGASGDVSAWSLMGNVIYDIKTRGRLTPYIGVGAGVAGIDWNDVTPVGGGSVDDNATVFAYQGIAGAAYRVNHNLQLTLDYRYFATEDPVFTTSTGTNFDSDYQSHTVLVGLRWTFGEAKPPPAARPSPPPPPPPVAMPQPEPAPMPTPAPAPVAKPKPKPAPPITRSFLVFFDWDKSDITPEARQVISQAAANSLKAGVVRINLTGHADRSGPNRYNMALSLRRANAVKREMMRNGVAAKDIAVLGRGETQLLVPTPDGVREPQNRRVEIVF